MSTPYAEVALPPPVARELTYRMPAEGADLVRPGALVVVPVARRRLSGIVTGVGGPAPAGLAPAQIRPLECVVDPEAVSPELLRLCRWMAAYYLAPLGSALAAALPPGLMLASGRLVRLAEPHPEPHPAADNPQDESLLQCLRERGPQRVAALRRRIDSRRLEASLRRLRQRGAIEVLPVLPAARARQRLGRCWCLRAGVAWAAEAAARDARAPRQAACLRYLGAAGAPVPRAELVAEGVDDAVLAALERQGLAERSSGEVIRDPLAHLEPETAAALSPTPAQQQVIEALRRALVEGGFHPALLQGVTGSGKTLVYMELVATALALGRSAIVLVPEIALAWQMVRRFRARFGDQTAVLHSQLSPGERYDTWRRLRRGEQRVVIGARSAVLAPLPDLGLIVVDEEHDAAYKQEDLEGTQLLSYSARDVALVRGQHRRAVVLLGSATPSLESHHNAQSGRYHRYVLPQRVDDRPLPVVHVVDMRLEPRQGAQLPVFSRLLRQKMRERLDRGQQIVLLQNRRGFAPFVVCGACGAAVHCPDCRVGMTCHRDGERAELCCHYCNRRAALPPACPACGSPQLRLQGVGTQRVEQVLLQQFRGVRVIRMDVDTTGWKGAHDELVQRFRRGEAQVLLGTQMVAKGLDFPEVTLVGVISADTGMHLPDFRAAERSFQLLTQVAGRSGRGAAPGEVVIQTLLPQTPALLAAAAQDFGRFAAAELAERREACFPPFARLALVRWCGPDEALVREAARRGADALRASAGAEAVVLGPAPAPLARLRGRCRYHAVVSASGPGPLHAVLSRAGAALRAELGGAVELTVNIDPLTMM